MKPLASRMDLAPHAGFLTVVLAAVVGTIWSWGTWPDPTIDFGRELYVPWRLTHGDVLYRSIQNAIRLSERARSTERGLKKELRQLGDRLGQVELRSNARPYEQAISLAERGERAEHLVSCFGLAEAEANLISLLHGGGSR